jgi:2-keto-4-pentenoate hydratase/2-oxohepta-3-ene-1,7-dioic acid hydratase in catechol pathway
MRYCRFITASGPQYGRVETINGVETITALMPPPEEDVRAQFVTDGFKPLALSEAKLLASAVPSKIVCVGRNYRDHAAELGNDVPVQPLLFFKPPSSIIAQEEAIVYPKQSERVDFEGELGIVIGKTCSKLAPDTDVREYIRGYTVVNDVTARDLQKKDGQWARAKGFDTFCPIGSVVTDEIDPFIGVEVITKLNGETRQHGSTRDFIFDIPTMIRYIADVFTLLPGDLIATGTPAGVGPMKPGDVVDVTVQGIGTLRSWVKA